MTGFYMKRSTGLKWVKILSDIYDAIFYFELWDGKAARFDGFYKN